MPDLITAVEYIDLNSTPLATLAWRALNVSELWQSADVEGRDTIIPGTHGARPNRRWRRPTQRTIELEIFGDADRTGTPYANQRTGLYANVAALKAAVCADPGGDGTVTCTVHLPDGSSTITGPVHVLGLGFSPHTPTMLRATIRISIPAGQLA